MPTWGELLNETNNLAATIGIQAFDVIRHKYLTEYAQHTGRNVISYATAWTQKSAQNPAALSIIDEDMQGLMEVTHGLQGGKLDLFLHSPGGSPEAAEAFVHYLRSKFTHVRAVIPQAAMSAATMIACGCDEILMGKHSSMGPIDPQLIVVTPLGGQSIPAQAILDQFEMAKKECQDPAKMNAWVPILSQYGPALLKQCQNALDLAEELVATWLENHMFAGDPHAKEKAKEIAKKLAAHNDHKSHSRHLPRPVLESYGLKVLPLEEDQKTQDLALSIFHATTLTFGATALAKVIENQNGRMFMKILQMAPAPPAEPPPPAPTPPIP